MSKNSVRSLQPGEIGPAGMNPSTDLDGEAWTADLESGDPQRVAWALRALDSGWRHRQFVALKMPAADCLEAFGDDVPEEMIKLYQGVVENYLTFDPPPSNAEIRRALLDAAIEFGKGRAEVTYQVALAVRIKEPADYAVRDILNHLRDMWEELPFLAEGAKHLVDQLLDSTRTRPATVDALRLWRMLQRFPSVLEHVQRRLGQGELNLIKED